MCHKMGETNINFHPELYGVCLFPTSTRTLSGSLALLIRYFVGSFFYFAYASRYSQLVRCKISDKEAARERQKVDGARLEILIFQKSIVNGSYTMYKGEFVCVGK